MKKLIALLLALVMIFGLVACGKTDAPAADAPAADAPAVDAPAVDAPAGESVKDKYGFDKLDVSLFSGGYAGLWEEIIALFETYYPGVEVTADISQDNALRARSRMLTDDPPDVMYISDNDYNLPQAAADGTLYDLSDWFANGTDADGIPMSEVVDMTKLSDGYYNGELNIISFNAQYLGWWYNKALFDEKGWTAPTTWEEMEELTPKILAEGIIPFMYQAPSYGPFGLTYQLLASRGGRETFNACMVDLEEGAWLSDGALAAISAMDEMVKMGFLSQNSAGADFAATQIDFCNDRVAMIPCGMWFENEMKDSIPEGFEMTFMPFPSSNGSPRYLVSFGDLVAVSRHAKNPEAAKAFLGVLLSKEGQKIVAKYTTPIASTLTADDIAEYMSEANYTALQVANEPDVEFVSNSVEGWYPAINAALRECNDLLVLQEITPEEYCQMMEDAAEATRNDPSIYMHSSN